MSGARLHALIRCSRQTIAKFAGPDVILVDSAATTADTVARVLAERGLAATNFAKRGGETPFHSFLVTDAPDRITRVGAIFLGQPIDPGAVELVDLQD